MRTNTLIKRSSKKLFGFYAALWIGELDNSIFDVTNRSMVQDYLIVSTGSISGTKYLSLESYT